MSFGRPSNTTLSFSAKPPDRGSFPLDHEGECKDFMIKYLDCMKTAKSKSTDCRLLSKDYLECRMEKGLMQRVAWEDLGFQESGDVTAKPKHDHPPAPST